MAHISTGVEYGLHCLTFLAANDARHPPSVRELAEMQGIPQKYVAKLFTRLHKAGLIKTEEGVRGGMRLARDPGLISVLDVVKAIDGEKPLFDCREIRANCALFDGNPPLWATDGLCGIHSIMRMAEMRMHEVLAECTIAGLASGFLSKAPDGFGNDVMQWFEHRASVRTEGAARTKRRESR